MCLDYLRVLLRYLSALMIYFLEDIEQENVLYSGIFSQQEPTDFLLRNEHSYMLQWSHTSPEFISVLWKF